MEIEWWIAAGSTYNSGAVPTAWEAQSNGDRAAGLTVNIGASTSDDFYITGIQLEVGEQATPFEHRSFADELAKCQRYFYSHAKGSNATIANGSAYTSSQVFGALHFPVTMRITPSLSYASGTNYYRFYRNGSGTDFDGFSGFNDRTENAITVYKASLSGLTAGHSGWILTNNDLASITFDSEL